MAHVFLLIAIVCSTLANADGQRVLMISLDGFRWDYLIHSNLTNLTSFHRMISDGAWAVNGIKNTFLTKTFPNHFTLVTGLYEETHGIVGNEIYDPVFNATFSIAHPEEVEKPRWYTGEPIWVTNQIQDTNHHSGCVMWPSSIAPIEGFMPHRLQLFDKNVSYLERVQIVVDWFVDDSYPINLGLLYIEEPDHTGHISGPDSENLKKKLIELDKVLEELFYKLEDLGILDTTDIIVTSDHGMTNIPDGDAYKIDLNKYIDINSYFVTSTNPVTSVFPLSDTLGDEIIKNLTGVPHLHVYRREHIPADYHYTHNRRIPPILLEPDEHYWVCYNNSAHINGQHGYNNSLKSMHPIFLAMGPSFKKGATVDTFNNVDVYPLLCKILGLKPAPNNGSLEKVSHLLVDRLIDESNESAFWIYVLILVLGSMVTGIFSLAACQAHRQYRRRLMRIRTLDTYTLPQKYKRYNKADSAPLMSETSEEEFNVP